MPRLPTLFVSHGGPNLILKENKSHAKTFWKDLLYVATEAQTKEQVLDRIKAIVVISAHWISDSATRPSITITKGAPHHPQIYDFYGFPDEMYQVKFHAKGDDNVALRAKDLIDKALNTESVLDDNRGLDHGTWVPLLYAMKERDLMEIPVVQVSLLHHSNNDGDSAREVQRHVDLGRALAPLRDEGVLVIGSGSETHNLRNAFTRMRTMGMNQPYGMKSSEYVVQFLQYLGDALVSSETKEEEEAEAAKREGNEAKEAVDAVVHYRERTPSGRISHPTQDHYLPLAVALGASLPVGGDISETKLNAEKIYDSTEYGELSMGIYKFMDSSIGSL